MPTRHHSRTMSGNQAEILEKLMQMKKELARKEKKLKKCVRATSAKEYVKRRLREQEVLEVKTSAVHLTSDLCLPAALPQKTSLLDRSNKTSPFVSISPNHCRITQSLDLATEPGPAGNITVDTHGSTGVLTTSQHEGSDTNTVKSGSFPDNAVERTSQPSVFGDRNVETVSVNRMTCLQPDQQKSEDNGKHFFQNNRTEDVVCANTYRLGTNSKAEILFSESGSDKGLSWNSSGESVSSAEHQGRRSLSLKRKRNISSNVSPPKGNKCEQQTFNTHLARSKGMVSTTAFITHVPVNLPDHSVVGNVQTAKNNGRISNITDSSLSNDDEKIPAIICKQKEPISMSTQEHPVGKNPEHHMGRPKKPEHPMGRPKTPEHPMGRLKKPEHPMGRLKKPEPESNIKNQEGSENSRVKRKCVKRRRRTIGRILDVDLEKDINFSANSESSQNCEEYETLRLIQQSYRLGVDYSTRHGKTHNLPSMLSSIFQYFIDENRRQKDPCDFSLPEDQFGRLMRKRLKEITLEFSNNSQHEEEIPRTELHMDESGLNSIETSQGLFHPNRQGMESTASLTDHPRKLKIKSDKVKETQSVNNFASSHQHCRAVPKAAVDVHGEEIVGITDTCPVMSVQCPPVLTCDHTRQEHSKGYWNTSSDCWCKKQPSENQNSLAYNKNMKLSSNCFESQETPKSDTESCVYSEEFIPMSPALFASPPDGLGTEDSLSVGDWDSQDSQLIHTRRSNKGEKLKHLGCIKLSQTDSLRCVAACCIQIIRRRTDVVLCIGQSTISLWNQTGDTYTCVDSWQLEQDYSSVECYTYPAVFRDKFCYFVVVLRGAGCTVQVVHYNARTDKPQLIQCLQGNRVTACCLSVEALAVGQTYQAMTKVTKYSVDYDGQLMVQQEFDPSPYGLATPRCLMLVENLQSALVLWSSNNTLALWNTDTGTLVWTLDLSLTWPEMSTLVSAQWQQEYLLLSLLTEKKADDAGVLLVVNPETEISKILIHYNATSWEGLKCGGQLEDSIAATDHRGQTCVWEPYTGQLSYQCDPSTGVKGLGHYWRKVIAMYNHCVHIFK
ncbi:uncharacterized protein LOC110442152 [Mizuhopecten yessoensis]|uniref:Partner and localizer of BRCA2 n=1 Tax=Mizuhopecten yessoensis TaxID=6573 RepID=A0A210PHV5_MIZYE|nr:uncharacterized protein LOC110442152 [Mizuhopecten yessoensis]OWF36063.1 hypothetical protein KP79_PYT06539 [Mizuhopecten yessoensis]